MARFSLKTFAMLCVIVALSVALFISQSQLAKKTELLTAYRNELRLLDIQDTSKIHVVAMPGMGRKSWRWRLFLPTEKKFRVRVAYDQVPIQGLPNNPRNLMLCELPPGESILTANLNKNNGTWGLTLHSETEGSQNFDFTTDVQGKNTKWLDKRGGNSLMVAGNSQTESGAPDQPLILLSFRDGLSPRPGVVTTNPNPTDGVILWITEMK